MIKFFNVDLQYQQDRDIYLDLADRVYSSGQVINGKYCRKLEDSLKARTGRKHCVLTASCTDALAFVGSALQSEQSNNFIFPNLSFPATNNGFARESKHNLDQRIYIPVDNNGNIDLELLKNKLHFINTYFKTKTIVVWVNLFGHTVDFDLIAKLQKQYPTVDFVEDAAQSIGASWKDTPSGSVGVASCFSFDPTKNLGAFGIGGAVLTDSDKIADTVDLHRRPHTPKWINHGYNSQINEIDAAIVWWKLENRFDDWQKRRTEIANYYIDRLKPYTDLVLPNKKCISAWHKFVIKHPARDTIKEYLKNENIETRIHYPNTLDNQKIDFNRQCLSLPIYPELTDGSVEHITQSVISAIKLIS